MVLVVLAVIGPLGDQWYMRRFPESGRYGPGIAPVLASYVILVLVGHGVMRLFAGPAREDRLACRAGILPKHCSGPECCGPLNLGVSRLMRTITFLALLISPALALLAHKDRFEPPRALTVAFKTGETATFALSDGKIVAVALHAGDSD
jgi:hypothetical protein